MKVSGLRELYFFVAIAVVSCAPSTSKIGLTDQEPDRVLTVYGEEITYAGGLGRSCSDAVLIIGASDDVTCVEAQYAWIRAEFTDFQPLLQQLILPEDGRRLSEISIETPSGKRQICFDISECETLF